MQKTKLGISVGLLGAIFFFAGFFGGYLVTILMAGYILLVEDNAWLERVTVKGVVLMLFFQETEAQRTLRLCLRSRGVSVRLEAECRRRSTSVDPPSSGRWMLRSGCWWLSVW